MQRRRRRFWLARRPTRGRSRDAWSGYSAGSTPAPVISPCASRAATSSRRWTRRRLGSYPGSGAANTRRRHDVADTKGDRAMKFGLHSVNLHTCGYPDAAARFARSAEGGGIADDYLAAMRAVWTQAKPSYRGPFVSFEGVQAMPRPVQRPTPPIVVGGRTAPAFRRAVTQGHGWYGFGLDVAETQKLVAALRD